MSSIWASCGQRSFILTRSGLWLFSARVGVLPVLSEKLCSAGEGVLSHELPEASLHHLQDRSGARVV